MSTEKGKELFWFSQSHKATQRFVKLTHNTLTRFAGKFDDKRALKLFENNAKDAARAYCKAHCAPSEHWNEMFSIDARKHCARMMLQQYKERKGHD